MLPGVTSVLWLSVLLQIVAAVLALRLIPVTGKTFAWVLLSFAFILMASRRAISLLYQQGMIQSEWLTAMTTEMVALIISLLILSSAIMLKSVFVKQRQDEDELRKLSQVVEENSSSTIITDLQGKIEYVNHRFTEVSGYALDDVKGKTTRFLKSGKTPSQVFNDMWKSVKSGKVWVGEMCNRSRDGSLQWVKARISPVTDTQGITTHYVAVLEDITEQKAQRDALEYMAMHDALTDLPNRALFYDRLSQAILKAEHNQRSLAVLLMDLNHFKMINDTLGHHMGDRVLKKVSSRMKLVVKSFDTVARMGGDEFLLLLNDVNDEQAEAVAQRLIPVINETIVIDGHNFEVGMSIGIAMYPRDGDDPDALIQRADVAMYSAKKFATGVTMYDTNLDEYSVGRLNLLGALRHALEDEQFCLYYQPRMNLDSMTIEGAEALVRWQHPDQGLLQPDKFIPLLEETGYIRSLTRWIIRQALRQLTEWRVVMPEFRVSINISTRDLCDKALAADLAEILRDCNLTSESVILEITESSLMQYTQYTSYTLQALEKMGVRLAIDDYGTGYSSLSYLKELPVSELKIDKSFVMNMLDNENDEVIVRSTIDLGHNLGLNVVAEGVEDARVSSLLQDLRCGHAQGFYYSKPVTAKTITEKLTIASCLDEKSV